MTLLNVRLDTEYDRKLRLLRGKGIVAAQLVRRAIDSEYEQVRSQGPTRDLAKLVRELHAQYPDDGISTGVCAHVRAEVAALIRGRLLEKERRIRSEFLARQKQHKHRHPASG